MGTEFTNPDEFKLVWSEEFDHDSLSLSDWSAELRSSGVYNSELQAYVQSEKNIFIKDGMLHLSPCKEHDTFGNVYYTSGLLNTLGKHEFLYGRFEVRAKSPRGRGLFPFVKLCSNLNEYAPWPIGGQIDFMTMPCHVPGKNYATVHYGEVSAVQQCAYSFPEGNDASADFHVYAVDWVPGKISFFIDGESYFEVSIDEPFTHALYLEVGLSVGGSLGSTPDETTRFEDNDFIVDYIRVFQKEKYEKKTQGQKRKFITVCGSWIDAENFNSFLSNLDIEEIRDKYVVAAFSFGIPDIYEADKSFDESKFAEFVNLQDSEALIIFAEMVKNDTIVQKLIDEANAKNIPVFTLERKYSNAINISMDHVKCFEEICRHIVEYHGIRNVEMFAGIRGNSFSDSRIAAFKKVLEENGITYSDDMVYYGDFYDITSAAIIDKLVKNSHKMPEAFICANDSMAIGVTAALSKHGYRVPEDIKVTGFDGNRSGQINNPPLTTGVPDYRSLIDKLIEVIDNWDKEGYRDSLIGETVEFGCSLLPNHSCGCLSENRADWKELVNQFSADNEDCIKHMFEMGKFVSSNVNSSDLLEAMSTLERYIWLWNQYYYYVGFKGSDNKLRTLFTCRNNKYKVNQRFTHLSSWVPDIDSFLDKNSNENFLLFRQVRVQSDDFAFVCCGYDHLRFRTQQRFEELSLFISAVMNSVCNNQKYIKANNEIEKISGMDYLTGLYNRRGFFREIERRINEGKAFGNKLSLALFSVDMDGLKSINDQYGHQEGDAAISIFANVLLRFCAGNGICSRYGGDEFAFAFISNDSEPVDIDFVRKSMDLIISNDYSASSKPYKIGASIGFAECDLNKDFDMEALINQADKSMYLEKQRRHQTRK